MLFVAICVDKPNHLELRNHTRDAHIRYMTGLGDVLKFAGRIMSGPDDTPSGSILFLEAESRAHASALLDEDPYRQAGLFEHTAIEPFSASLGAWREGQSIA
ncbi:MAG: YciI family protein [Sphingomonadales bacterium]